MYAHPRHLQLVRLLMAVLVLAGTVGAFMSPSRAWATVERAVASPPVVDDALPGTSCADVLGVRCDRPSDSTVGQGDRVRSPTSPPAPVPSGTAVGVRSRIALLVFFGASASGLLLALILLTNRSGTRRFGGMAAWAVGGLEVVVVLCLVAAVGTAVFRTSGSDARVADSRFGVTAPAVDESFTPGRAVVATATGAAVHVFDRPGRRVAPRRTFANPWRVPSDPPVLEKLVFVVQRRSNGWVNVLLPTRPNGVTGWIPLSEVSLSETPYWIHIELSTRRLTVLRDGTVIARDTVAIGSPRTPTPTGTFFVTALLQAPRPNTIYGPYAFALSGFSSALTAFNGGDGELGIHGNNDPSSLGNDVTHGCIRVSNAIIRALVGVVPLGAPVEVVE